jgi:hypothetical protein
LDLAPPPRPWPSSTLTSSNKTQKNADPSLSFLGGSSIYRLVLAAMAGVSQLALLNSRHDDWLHHRQLSGGIPNAVSSIMHSLSLQTSMYTGLLENLPYHSNILTLLTKNSSITPVLLTMTVPEPSFSAPAATVPFNGLVRKILARTTNCYQYLTTYSSLTWSEFHLSSHL